MSTKLSHLTKWLADLLGESSEQDTSVSSPSLQKINEYLKEHSLSSLLPYEMYDPTTQLYHNRGSIGFVLACQPLFGANPEALNVIDTLFKEKLPEHSTFHVLLYASADINPLLNEWKNSRIKRSDVIYEKLVDYRIDFMRNGSQQRSFKSEKTVFRDFKMTIDVTFPPDTEEKRILECKRECIETLSSLQMRVGSMDCEQFIKYFYSLLNPTLSASEEIPAFNLYDSLAPQLIEAGQSLQIKKHALYFDEGAKTAKTFRITEYPSHWDQWKMGDLIGDTFNHTLRLGCPFLLSFMAYIPSSVKEQARAHAKSLRTSQQANTALIRFLPKLRAINNDWGYALAKLQEGERLIKTSFQITLYASHDTIAEHEASLSSLLQQKKWKFSKNKYVQLPAFLLNLPMMMNQDAFSELTKFNFFKTLLSSNIKNIIPLQGDSRGQQSPLVMLSSRRGQIQFFDPFDNPTGNYNVSVAAKSGAGKSYFVQEYCLASIGRGDKVCIIDVGRSYQNLVRLLNGQFIEFSDKNPVSLNPFSQIKDLHEGGHLQLLKPLFAQMASPTTTLQDLEMSLIEQAITESWNTFKNNTTVSHIADWLKNHEHPRAVNLGTQLFSYTDNGMYGSYFSGSCTLDFSNPLICLELEELKSKKDLQGVVLLLVMYHISQAMYLGNRVTRISCIIDEAWDLLKTVVQAAQFIEENSRRARKYNGNIVTITQSFNDYFTNPAAKAAFDNADWQIILAHKAEAIDQLILNKRLNIDPYTEKLVRSLNTIKSEYSEILIRSSHVTFLGRLALDPFSDTFFSTTGEDFAALRALEAQGHTLVSAIELRMKQKRGINV